MLVIIVTSDGYATIRKTLRCLRPQTVCDQLEIVVVAPLARELADAVELKQFNHGLVEVGPMNSTAAVRVAGARLTAAPIIAITEDHSYPDPRRAECPLRATGCCRFETETAVRTLSEMEVHRHRFRKRHDQMAVPQQIGK
jgi:hypothetical protein